MVTDDFVLLVRYAIHRSIDFNLVCLDYMDMFIDVDKDKSPPWQLMYIQKPLASRKEIGQKFLHRHLAFLYPSSASLVE